MSNHNDPEYLRGKIHGYEILAEALLDFILKDVPTERIAAVRVEISHHLDSIAPRIERDFRSDTIPITKVFRQGASDVFRDVSDQIFDKVGPTN